VGDECLARGCSWELRVADGAVSCELVLFQVLLCSMMAKTMCNPPHLRSLPFQRDTDMQPLLHSAHVLACRTVCSLRKQSYYSLEGKA
jgi:hypothetical protein